jgi:hypothetical protein
MSNKSSKPKVSIITCDMSQKRDKYQLLFDDFDVKTDRILGGLKKGTPAHTSALEKATNVLTIISKIIETCEQVRSQMEHKMSGQAKIGLQKIEDLEKDLKDLIGPLKATKARKTAETSTPNEV